MREERLLALLVLLAGVIASGPGCGSDSASSAAQPIALRRPDGLVLTSDSYAAPNIPEGEKPPVAVLLHMLGGSAADWKFVAQRLSRQGISVLVPDLRGHGRSRKMDKPPMDPARFGPADVPVIERDLDALFKFLGTEPRWDGRRILLVGAGLGGNLAVRLASRHTSVVRGVAVISGSLDTRGATTREFLPRLRDTPILFLAAEEDAASRWDTQKMYDLAVGPREIQLVPGKDRGTDLLSNDTVAQGQLMAWLAGHAGKDGPPPPGGR